VIGIQTFGKGSVQTILPLGNNAGLKLTTARYYTPAGRSIQAKGIEPDISVDDGRESRIKEANLERHLETAKTAAAMGDAGGKAAVVAVPQIKPGDLNKAEVAPLLPRFEFGADDDFQLQQAMNHLKGAPVIASTKAVAANSAVPTAVKP
jgi:carboxyl-terminal processing protease